jgi:hypothetical protein
MIAGANNVALQPARQQQRKNSPASSTTAVARGTALQPRKQNKLRCSQQYSKSKRIYTTLLVLDHLIRAFSKPHRKPVGP